jgi:hypothetical protein
MKSLRIVLPALVLLIALGACSQAGAQQTLGQTNPEVPFVVTSCKPSEGYDEFQVEVSSGTQYRVPSAGVITSWSTQAGPELGQLYALKLYRITGDTTPGAGTYTVLGHDNRSLVASVLNTFPVSIPVQAGDLIGTHVFQESESARSDCLFDTGLTGDQIRYSSGNALDNTPTGIASGEPGHRINVSVTLLGAPAITAVSPAKGSIKGASVTIAGTEFAQVSAVSFGSTPAKSFTVDSEGQITAVAPASKTLAKVPVTVTTSAGTATSPTTFAYEGCKVPKLNAKKLKAAKKKLKKAGCKPGKVTKKEGATGADGKVSKQSPKPGKVLAPGSKVKLTLKP